jgi:16S rRNA A1518/A1519 N6-dimethyltransferase RsmA/KsgA/DIM1 with predicted DNA glycosylase/AP lyase activity
MPSSHSNQINEIIKIALAVQPQSVLDIGVGFGKYGF